MEVSFNRRRTVAQDDPGNKLRILYLSGYQLGYSQIMVIKAEYGGTPGILVLQRNKVVLPIGR
jgi:hypothetical protein